jgi:polyisoprenoid-binding protein YceI
MVTTWLLLAWALGAMQIDPATRVGFTLQTRWGQTLHGRFPRVEGRIEIDAADRRRTFLRLDASMVEIAESARYSRFARSARFFDAARYPQVEFTSDPYSVRLLHEGGILHGDLRLHGVQRRESFTVLPSACARPGVDCEIVAHGTVRRSAYGLGGWSAALREGVTFTLRVRTREEAP